MASCRMGLTPRYADTVREQSSRKWVEFPSITVDKTIMAQFWGLKRRRKHVWGAVNCFRFAN